MGCDHHSPNGFPVQPNNSIFDLVAVRSPKLWWFHANQIPSGTASDKRKTPSVIKPGRRLPFLGPRKIFHAIAAIATSGSGRLLVLIRQAAAMARPVQTARDRKSTRLNSSHTVISYA